MCSEIGHYNMPMALTQLSKSNLTIGSNHACLTCLYPQVCNTLPMETAYTCLGMGLSQVMPNG